jgi:hypothetical protein
MQAVDPNVRRKQEIFAWTVMAAIWIVSAANFYLLWAKTN